VPSLAALGIAQMVIECNESEVEDARLERPTAVVTGRPAVPFSDADLVAGLVLASASLVYELEYVYDETLKWHRGYVPMSGYMSYCEILFMFWRGDNSIPDATPPPPSPAAGATIEGAGTGAGTGGAAGAGE
jgi:hypothetical protein